MLLRRNRPSRTLELHQLRYVNKLKERYPCGSGGGAPKTPFSTVKWGEETYNVHGHRTIHEYQSMLGSLLHCVACTRPDLAYACGRLAQFSRVRADHHWNELERCMKYAFSTASASLIFHGGEENLKLEVFSDADDAADTIDRRSRTGMLIKFGGAAVMWKSKKQGSVTLFSTESEYVAATTAAQEVMWMRELLREFQVPLEGATCVYVDNISAITIAKDVAILGRSKHVARRLYYLRERLTDKDIVLQYVPSTEQVADYLTKPLPAAAFTWCRHSSGLVV